VLTNHLAASPGAASRRAIAARFLHGSGIEIGALHRPLRVPASVRVRYVDRLTEPELRAHYPELAAQPLVQVDVVDDGERLASFSDATLDFVIASHFLEHCQDPVRALFNMLRVLRPLGVLYLAVPDKRFTFDAGRPVTTIEHVFRDFSDGPDWSRRAHFYEWTRLVDKIDEAEAERHTADLMARNYSIHCHVWTQKELLELLVAVQNRLSLDFDIALLTRNGHENIAVLEKSAAPNAS
jgi:predicted SAM-dependent methyltransferase